MPQCQSRLSHLLRAFTLPSVQLLLLAISLRPASNIQLFSRSCTHQFFEERSAPCAFPSIGPDGQITQCVRQGESSSSGEGASTVGGEPAGSWWCPTTMSYCIDGTFRWCPATGSTFGGSDPGRECQFPFWYKGAEYRHCLRLDTRGENYLWCSTTPGNYSGRWTRCRALPHLMPCHFASKQLHHPARKTLAIESIANQCVLRDGTWTCRTSAGDTRRCDDTPTTEAGNSPGRPCRFPFRLSGVWHKTCVNDSLKRREKIGNGTAGNIGAEFKWCSTTDNFDRDRLWTRCKPVPAEPWLTGLKLFLTAVGGLLGTACVAAGILYCLCEPSAPCKRRWRQRQRGRRRRQDWQSQGSQRTTSTGRKPLAAAVVTSSIAACDDGRLLPTAPPPPYEEVVGLTAMMSGSGGQARSYRDVGVPA